MELFDFNEKTSIALPSLEPLDLTWIQNPKLQTAIEVSIKDLPYFIGSFYHNLLDQIEGANKENIISTLNNPYTENQQSSLEFKKNYSSETATVDLLTTFGTSVSHSSSI